MIWFRSANSHTGPQLHRCIRGRTDGSIRLRANLLQKPLAFEGASTDEYTPTNRVLNRISTHSDRLLLRLSLVAAKVALPFWSMNLTLAPRQNWCAAMSGMRPRRHRFDYEEKSGYIVARMPFAIVLAPEAVEDLRRLKANVPATMRRALETHLRRQPEKTSRSRIKRLRGLRRPQYRLRVGDIRVFYDVSGTTVQVLAIVVKSEAEEWLAQFANLE